MSPPIYQKVIYTIEEIKNIRRKGMCEEFNVFTDYNKLIVNLCDTIEVLMQDAEKKKT